MRHNPAGGWRATCPDARSHAIHRRQEDRLTATADRFDRAYYEKWYRDPRHRVATDAARRRRVAMVVGIAEYVLDRPIRSVLDVGCGEGFWRAPLLALRPHARYVGVDPSLYVVQRFGRRRGIRHGRFDALPEAGVRGPFDLVVSVDVLHFLDPQELARGLRRMRALMGGIAYLPAFTSGDAIEGDVRHVRWHSAAWYRRRFRAAGLVPLGLECYTARADARALAALERASS